MAEALYRIRRAERLLGQTNLVLVKDITERESGLEALRRFSYRPMKPSRTWCSASVPRGAPTMITSAALDAKYRRNAKDQVKKLTMAGCVVESLTDLTPHSTRLHELYLAVHRNASVRLVTLVESYLPQLALALGDDFRCTIIRRGEEILGFVTTIRDGDSAIAYYIGFDRAAAARKGCQFICACCTPPSPMRLRGAANPCRSVAPHSNQGRTRRKARADVRLDASPRAGIELDCSRNARCGVA